MLLKLIQFTYGEIESMPYRQITLINLVVFFAGFLKKKALTCDSTKLYMSRNTIFDVVAIKLGRVGPVENRPSHQLAQQICKKRM